MVGTEQDLDEFVTLFGDLSTEQKKAVVGNLTLWSLLKPLPEMPDPMAGRETVARLMSRLDSVP